MLSDNFYHLVSPVDKRFEGGEVTDKRQRPWRSFWPPHEEMKSSEWSKSEFPEISSWQFDPDRPFERPWREWTRTSRAKYEASQRTAHLSHDVERAIGSIDTRRIDAPDTHPWNARHDSQGGWNQTLGNRVCTSRMKMVIPASFYYLAALDLYDQEKPYLSRLPSMPGFKRTNIVGQSRSIYMHEISGHEDLFSLDESGFEFVKWRQHLEAWTDALVCDSYIPKLTEWLQERLKCMKVYVYAYNVSRTPPELRAYVDLV